MTLSINGYDLYCFFVSDELFKVHNLKPNQQWRLRFENYLKTMPGYYAAVLFTFISPFVWSELSVHHKRENCYHSYPLNLIFWGLILPMNYFLYPYWTKRLSPNYLINITSTVVFYELRFLKYTDWWV